MRCKPVGELTDSEMRMAIGQQLSLPILIPIALGRLTTDPLIEGDFYEGDLLRVVLAAKSGFCAIHSDLWRRAHQVGVEALIKSNQMDDSWKEAIQPSISETFKVFLERVPK